MFILFMLSPDFHLGADTVIEILVDILVLFDKLNVDYNAGSRIYVKWKK